MTALLTIDFDFFFRNILEAGEKTDEERRLLSLYDWGHREALFFLFDIWLIRAAAFRSRGLPLPGTTGEEGGFWARCHIAPDADLFLSESHLFAAHNRIATDVTEVVNVDAHHDAGYHRPSDWADHPRWRRAVPPELPKQLDCGNWAEKYLLAGVDYRVVYPRWKGLREQAANWLTATRVVDDGGEIVAPSGKPFTKVHVCRSGAWSPAWNDRAFKRFLSDLAPLRRWRVLGRTAVGRNLRLPARPWRDADVESYVAEWQTAMDEVRLTPPGSSPPPAR